MPPFIGNCLPWDACLKMLKSRLELPLTCVTGPCITCMHTVYSYISVYPARGAEMVPNRICFLFGVCTLIIFYNIRVRFFFFHCCFYYAMWGVFMSVVQYFREMLRLKECLKNQSYVNDEYDGKLLTLQTHLGGFLKLKWWKLSPNLNHIFHRL